MATTRRDIELLISAKETTGRSFQQVVSNIDALNSKIAEQIRRAEAGEISLQELRRTQEELSQAGRDLSALQGQIDAYNRLVASSQKVSAAYQKAQADLAAYKASLDASGETTTAQANKLQRLENAVVRTSAAVEKNTTDLAAQAAILQSAGVAAEQLEQSQTGIVNSARQVGAGLAQVNAAVNDYATNAAAARDREAQGRRQAAELARLEAAEKKAALAGEIAAERAAAAQRTALLGEIAAAEQRLAQQDAFDKKISDAQRLGDASRFVKLFADAVGTVTVAENQLSALSGFRAIGAQAAESSRDLSRFAQEGQSATVASSQVAAGLRAIIDPGAAALRTLEGVEDAIRTATVAADESVKNVGALSDVYNNLSEAAAALVRQGNLVDNFRQQEAAAAAARQQFESAQAEVQRLGQAMAQADQPTEELARSLQLAEQRLTATGQALNREETKLGELSRELRQAGIDTADLAAEQLRLETAARQAASGLDQINTTLGRGGRRTDGLFGLKPNDLANLSFQIQDIFVSLSSGQNPFIVLIQQGSQISQIFPGLISTIARFAVVWAPVLAVVGAVGAAIFELATDAQRLKQVSDDLAASPLGEGLDAARIAEAQEKLEGIASEAESAREAMLLLIEEGFDTDAIEKYAEAAGQLAERLGIDVVEATQLLVDVQQGGIEAVLDLTERTNDLTDADLDHAEALFEAGRAGEARQFVLDRVAERNQQIADATRSQWTPAVNNLKSAFQSFADFLGSVFGPTLDAISARVDAAIVGFTFLTGLLAGKGIEGARADAFSVIERQRGLTPRPARGASDQRIRDRRFAADLDEEIDQTRELTSAERLARAEREARNRAQKEGVSQALEERAVTQAIAAEQRKINQEAARGAKSAGAALRRADAARKRAERERLAEERKRDQAQRQLDGQLRQLNRAAFAGESATLEERLTSISEKYETIADSIAKVRSLGLTTTSDGVDLAAVERQVAATQQRLKDEETIKFFEERAATLAKQREDEIAAVLDAQKRNALNTTEATQKTAEIVGRLSPQITDAANEALKVARALAGTNPSPEMVSWIASLERIVSGEAADRSVADVAQAGFDQQQQRLDDLIRERDELVRSYETLRNLGLLTATEARELTTQAYAQQALAIQPVLDQLREQAAILNSTIDPLTQLPVLSDAAYGAWLNNIDAVIAGLAQIDPRLQQVNAAASQAIQGGVSQFFNTLAQSIVNVIGGTESFGDALGNLGRTALSVFASILDAIAQVLVQMVALQFAQSVLGVGGGGGGGGLLSFLFHDGGKVGGRGASRQVRTGDSPLAWIGAPKFHNGGGLGLRSDEYRAVLQRGEEVLTDDDPRHIDNLGKGGSGGDGSPNLKQVLLLDPEAVPNAMQTRSGQKSILTVIRQNKETIKQVLT